MATLLSNPRREPHVPVAFDVHVGHFRLRLVRERRFVARTDFPAHFDVTVVPVGSGGVVFLLGIVFVFSEVPFQPARPHFRPPLERKDPQRFRRNFKF